MHQACGESTGLSARARADSCGEERMERNEEEEPQSIFPSLLQKGAWKPLSAFGCRRGVSGYPAPAPIYGCCASLGKASSFIL